MTFLEYTKQFANLDLFIVLMDELDYPDEEIISKLSISKQTIYNVRRRYEPLMEALKSMNQPAEYGNPDVNNVINTFKEAFGTTSSNQYDRYAANRLVTKHGVQTIATVIKALASYGDDKYCPRTNSVRDLEQKWVQVISFLRSKSNSSVMVEL